MLSLDNKHSFLRLHNQINFVKYILSLDTIRAELSRHLSMKFVVEKTNKWKGSSSMIFVTVVNLS